MSHYYLDTYHTVIRWIADHIIILLFGVFIFQMFFPYNPMQLHSVTVLNPERAVPGSILMLEIKYDKFTDVQSEGVKVLICGVTTLVMTREPGTNPHGVDKTTIVPVLIPELDPTRWDKIRHDMGGKATCSIRVRYNYEMNPFRIIKREKTTQQFVVQ